MLSVLSWRASKRFSKKKHLNRKKALSNDHDVFFSYGFYRTNSSATTLSTFKAPQQPPPTQPPAPTSSPSVAQLKQIFSGQAAATTVHRHRVSAPPVVDGQVSSSFRESLKAKLELGKASDNRERSLDGPAHGTPVFPFARELLTPTQTPTTVRKAKRRSHIFATLSNSKHKNMLEDKLIANGGLGEGRGIPAKQGYLYKKSKKSLNKEWKKKYVTITTDGRLTYHPHLNDYIEDVHGKEIPLKHTTVKVPGMRFRMSKATIADPDVTGDMNRLQLNGDVAGSAPAASATPMTKDKSLKKRHRRHKSLTGKNGESYEELHNFVIVSLENKTWQFEAESADERDAWVTEIEQQILNSLQLMESDKSRLNIGHLVDKNAVQAIRQVAGNSRCIDCDAASE